MAFAKRVLIIAFIAWLCFRVTVVLKYLAVFGVGTPMFSHAPGPCKIFHVNGSEDIDVLPNGLAIISSGLRYFGGFPADPAMWTREGKLYAFDFNHPDGGIKEIAVENFDKSDFIPHGVDFYIDPITKETFLFVVNHGGGKESIEIFEFDEEQLVLKHRKKVTDKNIYHPNDVVAVGPDSFYATNDCYFASRLLRMIELFYPLKLGNVVFFNGTQSRIVASQMYVPNGINVDKTGKYIYVASTLDGAIFVFMRKEDNSLDEQQEINVGLILDNVFVDESNNLWIGSSGQTFAYFEYNANFSKPCPAKVIQVKLSQESKENVPFKVDDIVEFYSSRGEGNIKAASSAVMYQGKLLIGTVYGNLMYCDIVAT